MVPRWRRARYVRAVIRPVYLQLCGYLGTDPDANPLRWLDVPRSFASTDAVVTLTYPAAWNPDAAKQKNIDEVIRRHLGGDLAGVFGPHTATWRHPPAPPARAPFDGYQLPAHRIHLATLAGGRKWIADLEHEEPHLFIAAGTGGGKTATAALAAAHARAHGWLIDIIDPKRRSYIDRKTGRDVLTNVPGIRVHTSIESMMWALEEFFLSMLGVNIAVGAHAAWPGAFPQRMLVIDEFGTFAGMAARIHHRSGGTGPLPALDQRRQIEWQGRVAGQNALGANRQFAGSLGTQVVKIFDQAAARTGLRDHEAATAGYDPVTVQSEADDHKAYYPGSHRITMRFTGDRTTGRLLRVQMFGHRHAEIAKRIDIAATAIFHTMTVDGLGDLDLSYTPPLGSPWDAIQMGAQAWLRAASHS